MEKLKRIGFTSYLLKTVTAIYNEKQDEEEIPDMQHILNNSEEYPELCADAKNLKKIQAELTAKQKTKKAAMSTQKKNLGTTSIQSKIIDSGKEGRIR